MIAARLPAFYIFAVNAIVDEHNYLDAAVARQTAMDLKALLSTDVFQPPASAVDDRIGPLPLVDSMADAPAQAIAPAIGPVVVWAVDGGSATLGRIGRIEIIAWRAGCVRFDDHRRLDQSCPPPDIMAYDRLEAAQLYDRRFPEAASGRINGTLPDLAGGLRWLAEWRLVERIITDHDASAGEILLLVDGSLRGNPDYGLEKQRTVLRLAADKNIHVAAVSKQTGLTIDGRLPLDAAVGQSNGSTADSRPWHRRLSRPLADDSGWLGDVYLARLHPGADKAYRIDLNRYDSANPSEIFSRLASLADDIEFGGYPYPLAAAHRLARIDSGFKGEMIEVITRALEQEGIPDDLRETFRRDSHGQLNADLETTTGTFHHG
ncbi:MAG: DNA double-strand break repair nuclease NurA [candidate division Zixibacteria bacterium]|nr:DNA double-strand break repair nuclease NurA [candidate division Zixibacteria bacterium]